MLKKYESHKVVEADKIVSFVKQYLNRNELKEEVEYLLTSENGTQYTEREEIFARGEPQDDYFYLVKYEDGYTSWSPKKPFEDGYLPIYENDKELKPEQKTELFAKTVGDSLFDFGIAIDALKKGLKIARQGWNGKDVFIVYMTPLYLPPYNTQDTNRKVNDRTAKWIGEDTPLDSQGYFAEFTQDKKWQPGWTPSTSDVLAEDWFIVK